MPPGEQGLTQAFQDFMMQVEANNVDHDATKNGFFSYILTKKQRFQVQKVCKEQDWIDPKEKGVTLTREYFEHVLNQRKSKDNISAADCAGILSSAYSSKSEVAINKPRFEGDHERAQQALIFNANEKIRVGNTANLYGVAIIEISIKNLTPITAYHARGAKIKAFTKSR